jgi:hypothetical protein
MTADEIAGAAHRRAYRHLIGCRALLCGQMCPRCLDLEADAMRLAFRAELIEARGEALVALRAGATGT